MKPTTNLTKKIAMNSAIDYIFRGLCMLLSVYSLRLNLDYLGVTLYGLWVTIASVSSWMTYADFGIGNGFRNELAKAVALGDEQRQKEVIVTAVCMLSKVILCLFAGITLITEILIYTGVFQEMMRTPMYITNAFFCVNFLLGLVSPASYAYQEGWITSLNSLVTSVLRIATVLLLLHYSIPSNLSVFATLNGLASVFGCVVAICILCHRISFVFGSEFFKHYKNELRKEIVNLGLLFFVLQLGCLVQYGCDNLIIHSLLNDKLVTKYSVITTFYMAGNTLYSIVMVHFWSAVTAAAAKKNWQWIKISIRRLLLYASLYSIGVVVVSMFFNDIVKIWLGDKGFYYDAVLIGCFAVYNIASAFSSIFVNITNGLGELKPQLICCAVNTIIYLPLVCYFVVFRGMELIGIKLGGLICVAIGIAIIPLSVKKMLEMKEGM